MITYEEYDFRALGLFSITIKPTQPLPKFINFSVIISSWNQFQRNRTPCRQASSSAASSHLTKVPT